jgi:hypothetical protein
MSLTLVVIAYPPLDHMLSIVQTAQAFAFFTQVATAMRAKPLCLLGGSSCSHASERTPTSLPFAAISNFSRCIGWGVEAMRGSGADPYIGMKLHSVYTDAGLSGPSLSLQAGVGAGPNHPIYSSVARLMRSLLPAMERLGVATVDDVDIDTLARRIGAEAVEENATVVWISVVGAVTHTT